MNFRAQNKRNHILLCCILARICEEFSSIFFALKIREITFSDDVIFWRENPNIYTYIFFFIKIYFCRYWLMYKLNSNFFSSIWFILHFFVKVQNVNLDQNWQFLSWSKLWRTPKSSCRHFRYFLDVVVACYDTRHVDTL